MATKKGNATQSKRTSTKTKAEGNRPKAKKPAGTLAKTMAVIKSSVKYDPIVATDAKHFKESKPFLPSGSLVLDYLIGGKKNEEGIRPCPGVPRGAITQVYGAFSSGKTTFALSVAAATCSGIPNGTVLYLDWEHAIDPKYAKNLGVPIDDQSRVLWLQPDTLEAGLQCMIAGIENGVDLIVLDSVGSATPKEWMERARDPSKVGDSGRIGLVAAKWSYYLPPLQALIDKSKTAIIAISQMRSKINKTGYGPTEQPQGGEAWKYYSWVRLNLKLIKTERQKRHNALTNKMEDQAVSNKIRAVLDKCKVAGNHKSQQELYIRYGEGIDDVRSIIEIAKSHGIVKQSGAYYAWDRQTADPIKRAGIELFRKALLETEGAYSELSALTLAAIDAAVSGKGILKEDIDIDSLLGE